MTKSSVFNEMYEPSFVKTNMLNTAFLQNTDYQS